MRSTMPSSIGKTYYYFECTFPSRPAATIYVDSVTGGLYFNNNVDMDAQPDLKPLPS